MICQPVPEKYDRLPGATWVLPTENEWYKAAYYDPRTESEGGPPGDDHYWLYPTQSDVAPTIATANSVGDISNPGFNVANYDQGANWNGTTDGNLTTVGSAGPDSVTYYGTYDQAGNVGEWDVWPIGQHVSGLGGAYAFDSSFMTAYARNVASVSGIGPDSPLDFVGFRLAYVPEPSSLVLFASGLILFAIWQRRMRSRIAECHS